MNNNDFSVNYEKKTWVHLLDPRSKLIFILVFATVPLFFTDVTYLIACALLALPVWLCARIEIRPIRPLLVAIGIMAMISVLFSLFYNYDFPDQIVLFKLGPLVATDGGLRTGLMLGFRASIPAVVALVLITTTDPASLAKAMMKMKVPLSVAFMMMGALKMFPLVSAEMQNIKTAQLIRGVKYGSMKDNFKAFRLAVFPLIINSLRKSRVTGVAVESKGFGKRAWNEYYQNFGFKRNDYLMIGACIIVFVGALIVRYYFGLGFDPYVMA